MTYEPDNVEDRDERRRERPGTEPTDRLIDAHRVDPHEGGAAEYAAGTREDEVERLVRERNELKDLLLRKAAEFDNYRKRTDRERREREADAAHDLLNEILPIVDDFERALKADLTAGPNPLRAGIEIIYRQLTDLLRKRGVVAIDALGRDFDPHYHQAVEHVVSPGHRDGEVIDELRRGYLLGERLLRPAMVRVAKA
jgi:molecular chaperone GrpE